MKRNEHPILRTAAGTVAGHALGRLLFGGSRERRETAGARALREKLEEEALAWQTMRELARRREAERERQLKLQERAARHDERRRRQADRRTKRAANWADFRKHPIVRPIVEQWPRAVVAIGMLLIGGFMLLGLAASVARAIIG